MRIVKGKKSAKILQKDFLTKSVEKVWKKCGKSVLFQTTLARRGEARRGEAMMSPTRHLQLLHHATNVDIDTSHALRILCHPRHICLLTRVHTAVWWSKPTHLHPAPSVPTAEILRMEYAIYSSRAQSDLLSLRKAWLRWHELPMAPGNPGIHFCAADGWALGDVQV